jgi:hypothetical protein
MLTSIADRFLSCENGSKIPMKQAGKLVGNTDGYKEK